MNDRCEMLTHRMPPARGTYWRGVPVEMFSKEQLEKIVYDLTLENRRLEHTVSRARREPWRRG